MNSWKSYAMIMIFVLSISFMTNDGFALKSEGVSNQKILSDKICGDQICSVPESNEVKIRNYLNERENPDFNMSDISEIRAQIEILSNEINQLKLKLNRIIGDDSEVVLQQSLPFAKSFDLTIKSKPLIPTIKEPYIVDKDIAFPNVVKPSGVQEISPMVKMESDPLQEIASELTNQVNRKTSTVEYQFDPSKTYLPIFFNSEKDSMVKSGTIAYLAGNTISPHSYNSVQLGIEGSIVFMVADSFTSVRDLDVKYTLMKNKRPTSMSCTNYNEQGGPGYCSTNQNPVSFSRNDSIGIKIEVSDDPRPDYTLGSTPQIQLIFKPN